MQKLGRCLGLVTICVMFANVFAVLAHAQSATLTLHDGSSIRGTVRSLHNGVYTVDSASLGIVQIEAGNVKMLTYGSAATAAGDTSISPAQLNAMSSKLLSDPRTVALIQSLGKDPLMKSVLADPEVRAAMARGDYERLMNNPKILKLLDHEAIREITRKVR